MFIKFNTQLVNLNNVFCFDTFEERQKYYICCQDISENNLLSWVFNTLKERDTAFAELENKLLGES